MAYLADLAAAYACTWPMHVPTWPTWRRQVGGGDGDDDGALEATAKSAQAASHAMSAAAAAAPYRTAVLVRALLGLRMSAPMRIASAVGTWRAVAQRHRAARVLRGWRLEERLRLLTSAATVQTLIEEVHIYTKRCTYTRRGAHIRVHLQHAHMHLHARPPSTRCQPLRLQLRPNGLQLTASVCAGECLRWRVPVFARGQR